MCKICLIFQVSNAICTFAFLKALEIFVTSHGQIKAWKWAQESWTYTFLDEKVGKKIKPVLKWEKKKCCSNTGFIFVHVILMSKKPSSKVLEGVHNVPQQNGRQCWNRHKEAVKMTSLGFLWGKNYRIYQNLKILNYFRSELDANASYHDVWGRWNQKSCTPLEVYFNKSILHSWISNCSADFLGKTIGGYQNKHHPHTECCSHHQFFVTLSYLDGGSTKTFFGFFWISGPAGSGKPDLSILGESLGQEESNDTSSMKIGPAVPSTHLSRYSYFNPIYVSELLNRIASSNIMSTRDIKWLAMCILALIGTA